MNKGQIQELQPVPRISRGVKDGVEVDLPGTFPIVERYRLSF